MVLFSVASPSTTACIACKGTVAILSCCCCGLQMKRICMADAGLLQEVLVTCQSCLTACCPYKFCCTLSFIPSEVPAACCVGRESVYKTNRKVAASKYLLWCEDSQGQQARIYSDRSAWRGNDSWEVVRCRAAAVTLLSEAHVIPRRHRCPARMHSSKMQPHIRSLSKWRDKIAQHRWEGMTSSALMFEFSNQNSSLTRCPDSIWHCWCSRSPVVELHCKRWAPCKQPI